MDNQVYAIMILRGEQTIAGGNGEDTGKRWRDVGLTKARRDIIASYCLQLGGREWDGKLRAYRAPNGDYIHYAELEATWIVTAGVSPFADERAGRCRLAFVPVEREDAR